MDILEEPKEVAHNVIVSRIDNCNDVDKLKAMQRNVLKKGHTEYAQRCEAKIARLKAQAFLDLHSFPLDSPERGIEEVGMAYLIEYENLKGGRLASRTRQAIRNRGVLGAVDSVVSKSGPSDGFEFLREQNRLDISWEAVVLMYPDNFTEKARSNAAERLAGHVIT